ncbi:ABC transporter permease [Streptomyces sp. NPDC056661]|uniref:ABC transporter permease n=1 Tax=Streptomyces sp. NPDC056661 TaxID=3345898 RepID=UPI0036B1491B
MTTILTRPLDATARSGKVTLLRVLRSEWIKLRTVRSTPITLLIAVAAMVGLGMLVTHLRAGDLDARELAHFNGAEVSLSMFRPAQLAVGVLGVLMFTGEYSTGMIRATLTAVPRRLPMLAAKAVVFTGVVLVLMTAASFAAFLGGQAVLSSTHAHLAMNLSDPGVTRVVFGTALYLTVVGLLGLALGAIIRSSAGAIATLVGILLVLPGLGALLPADWAHHIDPYLPSNAGRAVLSVVPDPAMAPWTGLSLFAGYVAALLVIAAWRLKRRDA